VLGAGSLAAFELDGGDEREDTICDPTNADVTPYASTPDIVQYASTASISLCAP
jgi:hypothetical protein